MTTTDIQTTPVSALAVSSGQSFWTEEQQAALRQIGVEDASNGDLAVFLNFAQRTGLDPFSRQIYMISRNQRTTHGWTKKWTIQASIDGLRIVAQRSGEYAGQVGPEWCDESGKWTDVWLHEEAPAASRVGVMRRGFAQPLYAVALFREYVATDKDGKPTRMWKEKGALMIAKCAEALALRKAFPNDLSGIYTADEMSKVDGTAAQIRAEAGPDDHAEGLDPAALIEDATTIDELRALWPRTKDRPQLRQRITERVAALESQTVEGEIVEGVVDENAE